MIVFDVQCGLYILMCVHTASLSHLYAVLQGSCNVYTVKLCNESTMCCWYNQYIMYLDVACNICIQWKFTKFFKRSDLLCNPCFKFTAVGDLHLCCFCRLWPSSVKTYWQPCKQCILLSKEKHLLHNAKRLWTSSAC